MPFISKLLGTLIYWQDMFSPYLVSFTPAFCAEAPEAESVDAMQTFPVDC